MLKNNNFKKKYEMEIDFLVKMDSLGKINNIRSVIGKITLDIGGDMNGK